MVEIMAEDYVRTARAKGLTERRSSCEHAPARRDRADRDDLRPRLRGPARPAPSSPRRSSASRASAWPARRRSQRTDLPIISACVLIAATLIVVANIVVDVLYSVIDPRVRLT